MSPSGFNAVANRNQYFTSGSLLRDKTYIVRFRKLSCNYPAKQTQCTMNHIKFLFFNMLVNRRHPQRSSYIYIYSRLHYMNIMDADPSVVGQHYLGPFAGTKALLNE